MVASNIEGASLATIWLWFTAYRSFANFCDHINFEIALASMAQIFQYLFKYIHKGPERATYKVTKATAASAANNSSDTVDEIEEDWQARYLSAPEAMWRILGFHIQHKEPSVIALPIYLPNTTSHRQYHRKDGTES